MAIVNDPELIANLNRLLQLIGPLGPISLLETIVPVVSMGDVVARTITVDQVAFRSSDVFTAGTQIAPVSGTVLADTLALPAGTYDVIIQASCTQVSADNECTLQHRDAANAANLMENVHMLSGSNNVGPMNWSYGFGYELASNERLRILSGLAAAAGTRWSATIWARIRA